MSDNLIFNNEKYTVKTVTIDNQTITCRAFEDIIYVKNPVYAENQKLSIFVPECYYEGKGIGRYILNTAPIFMPNTVGGYMPGHVEQPGRDSRGRVNSIFCALLRGYVVVSPAVRGRGLKNGAGVFVGTAPAVMVDLKSVVRYLRYNRERIPGNVERIISNGTSAGGAISSLLAASGNHPDYEPYLEAVGAAKERDDIYAASCYCPITNLDHADMAYEWEFCGIDDYHRISFRMEEDGQMTKAPDEGVLSDLQKELSIKEKALFPEYLNSLCLRDDDGQKLLLDQNGDGNFKDYIKACVMRSIEAEAGNGTDLAGYSWISWENGKVTDIDWDAYVSFRTRMKTPPAFDDVMAATPENELFGIRNMQFRHFTTFSHEHSMVGGEMAESMQIKMMNPMNYIGDEKATTAGYYRIRHGAVDRDTSLAISAILVQKLRNHSVEVDYQLPWGVTHDGDYDLEDMFEWIDGIVQM